MSLNIFFTSRHMLRLFVVRSRFALDLKACYWQHKLINARGGSTSRLKYVLTVSDFSDIGFEVHKVRFRDTKQVLRIVKHEEGFQSYIDFRRI